ncbi:LOG family protein, partial [Acinetobacter baumannii]|nr:LOG family protein [Acinetobacter baumannii]
AMMNRESDILLALPGGIGTLDEVFTVMANTCIGIERKPIVFFNVDGCWNAVLSALKNLFEQQLISGQPADYYQVAETLEELEQLL